LTLPGRPMTGDGARRNSAEAQRKGHASRSGPEVEVRRVAKDSMPESSDAGNSTRSEKDPVERVRRSSTVVYKR